MKIPLNEVMCVTYDFILFKLTVKLNRMIEMVLI